MSRIISEDRAIPVYFGVDHLRFIDVEFKDLADITLKDEKKYEFALLSGSGNPSSSIYVSPADKQSGLTVPFDQIVRIDVLARDATEVHTKLRVLLQEKAEAERKLKAIEKQLPEVINGVGKLRKILGRYWPEHF